MEQYISKDAVVAEIERRIKKYATIDVGNSSELDALYGAKCHALKSILTFLDTLEVKEVDFEREFDNYIEDQNAFINNDNSEIKYYNGDSFNHTYDIYPLAKHFFELGHKA